MNNASNTYTNGVMVELFNTKYRFFPDKHMTKPAWEFLVKEYKTPVDAVHALQKHVYPENKLDELFSKYFTQNLYKMLYQITSDIIYPLDCGHAASFENFQTQIDGLCYTFYPSMYVTESQWNYLVDKAIREGSSNPQQTAYVAIKSARIFKNMNLFKDYNPYTRGGKAARRKTRKTRRRHLTIKKRRT
jgi:hypothetical protein